MTKKRGQMRLGAVCAFVSVQGLTLAFKMIKKRHYDLPAFTIYCNI